MAAPHYPFNKPASSISDQINLLKQRGLIIDDDATITHYLTHIGYYRLAGYWQIFQVDAVKHTFITGTQFDQIIDLYNFDRELRLLALDAIERIEIAFRTLMVQSMCMSHGPYWYTNATLTADTDFFYANLLKIDDELYRSKETFIIHHDAMYGKQDYPPAWKTLQVLSLGTLSKIYSNLASKKVKEKNIIARNLGLPNYVYFESWMQS